MKKLNKYSLVTAFVVFLVLGLTGPTAMFAAVPAPVDLLSAGNFVILSKTGITNVPTSAITGNIGTSPITGASITGLDCVEVTGTIYTVDATGPACKVTDATLLTTAVSDMEAAYTAAAGAPAGVGSFLNVGAGTVTGLTLVPGTYTWDSNVTIPTDLTLSGSATDIWIFQITGTLDMAANKHVILIGGAQASNVFWQVAGAVTLGAGSHFEGNILAKTNIAMITGATLNGRALAQTAVTLQSNTVSVPASVASSDVTLLTAAKTSAQVLITANAPESTTPGDHIVGSLATLALAQAAADATSASAQSVVDAQVVTLNAAIAAYNAAIVASSTATVNLGTAGNFVILTKTGIINVPTSAITGNIGTSPITGASITGLDCVEVTGTIYTVDATGPACRVTDATLLTTAVSDMEAAYTAAAGAPAGVGSFLNVGAGTVTGLTLVPGTYTWDSNVTIPTDLTLDAQGDANAVWIFQITGTLDIAAGKQVILIGGAQASNVFWQVADAVTLGAGSHFEGTILAQTNIAMITGATLNGRALAQTAVTLQSNTVSVPVKK